MNLFIMLIGLPGSGKSFFVKNEIPKSYPKTEFYIASTDDMIEAWGLENNLNYSQAWKAISESSDPEVSMKYFEKQMFTRLKECFEQGINVIVDRTNMSKKSRDKFLSLAPATYEKLAIVFEVGEDELNKRLKKRAEETGKTIPGFVIATMRKSYQPPTDEEFDEIIVKKHDKF